MLAAGRGGVVGGRQLFEGRRSRYGPYNILVNVVAPGLTDTPMLKEGMTDEALQELIQSCPLGRMADPMKVASVVVFLASQHASYISGATVNVKRRFPHVAEKSGESLRPEFKEVRS